MNELAHLGDFGIRLGLILDPVFQRFHVVIGRGLNSLHRCSIGFGEIGHQCIQLGYGAWRERGNFFKVRVGRQRLEPLNLNTQTRVDQAVLGKMRAQEIDLGSITAIQWRKRSQSTEVLRHEKLLNPV